MCKIYFCLLALFSISFSIQGQLLAQNSQEVEILLNETLSKDYKKRKKNLKRASIKNNKDIKNNNHKSFKTLFKKANKQHRSGDIEESIDLYKQCLSFKKSRKKMLKINKNIADNFFKKGDYKNAIAFYKNAQNSFGRKVDVLVLYKLANAMKYEAMYDSSLFYYNQFIRSVGSDSKFSYEKRRAILERKGCRLAVDSSIVGDKYNVMMLSEIINSKADEYAPWLRYSDVVFTREEEGNASIYNALYTRNRQVYIELFSEAINGKNEYTSDASFSKDGKTIYLTKCTIVQNKKQCQIYESILQNGVWEPLKKLSENINFPNSNCMQAHLTEIDSVEVLFFVSDRERGRGGTDIYYSEKDENGAFKKARNIGYPINTKYNEMSPFYSECDSTLYFSSNGHISLGGFDIYESKKDGTDDWSEPKNLLLPVNSSLDDFYFIKKSTTDAYFTSNRMEEDKSINKNIYLAKAKNFSIYAHFNLYAENSKSRESLDYASLHFKSEKIDTVIKVENQKDYIELAKYSDYNIVAQHTDFKDKIVSVSTYNIDQNDTIDVDIFFNERVQFEKRVLGVIYYDYDQSRLTNEAPKTLKFIVDFLNEYPNSEVEVAAHTDSKGDASYNMDLSKKRCKAAVNFLVFNKIAEDRIIQKWYGESMPKAPNTNPDGSDNEDGRTKNRRTEFILLDSN